MTCSLFPKLALVACYTLVGLGTAGLLLGWGTQVVWADAQDQPGQGRVAPAAQQKAERLIERLSHESFSRREQAMERLETLGEQARPALEAARESKDLEIRMRVARLLAVLDEQRTLQEHKDAEARIEAFRSDLAGTSNPSLPGFEQYRKVAGDDQQAREYFLKVYLAERELIDAYDKDPRAAVQILERRGWDWVRDPKMADNESYQMENLTAMLLVLLDQEATFSLTTLYIPAMNMSSRFDQLRPNSSARETKWRKDDEPRHKLFQAYLRTPFSDTRLIHVLELRSWIDARPAQQAFASETIEIALAGLANPVVRNETNPEGVAIRITALNAIAASAKDAFAESPEQREKVLSEAALQKKEEIQTIVEPYLDDDAVGPANVEVREAAILALGRIGSFPQDHWRSRSALTDLHPRLPSTVEFALFPSLKVRDEAIEAWKRQRAEAKSQKTQSRIKSQR